MRTSLMLYGVALMLGVSGLSPQESSRRCSRLRLTFSSWPRDLVEIWAVTTWAISYARNKFVHEQYLPLPQDTLDMAVRLLNDFQRVTAVQRLNPPSAT
ncbi:hypothetical protein FCV25MIE_09556 [Fagus crenata]